MEESVAKLKTLPHFHLQALTFGFANLDTFKALL